MTSTPTTGDRPDLADLDLLDDQHRHAWCAACYPNGKPPLGAPFIAWCGRRAVSLNAWSDPSTYPPDACPDCVNRPTCATGGH